MKEIATNHWYVAMTDSNADNEYGRFYSDDDAVKAFMELADGEGVEILEIWQCNDDECLTPSKLIWH